VLSALIIHGKLTTIFAISRESSAAVTADDSGKMAE